MLPLTSMRQNAFLLQCKRGSQLIDSSTTREKPRRLPSATVRPGSRLPSAAVRPGRLPTAAVRPGSRLPSVAVCPGSRLRIACPARRLSSAMSQREESPPSSIQVRNGFLIKENPAKENHSDFKHNLICNHNST